VAHALIRMIGRQRLAKDSQRLAMVVFDNRGFPRAAQKRFSPRLSESLLVAGTRLRTLVFLLAVVATNYTWSRPSPVDVIFFCALLLTPFARQRFNTQILVMFFLVIAWLACVYLSSISLIDKPNVTFELIALTSVAFIGITSCLVTAGWNERDLQRFVRVYVFAAGIAAVLGIFGYVTQNPDLTWAGRARGFFDDPDMFGTFLIPGILGTLYMIAEKRRPFLYALALFLLMVAEFLSFSRASIAAALFWAAVSFVFFNRRNLFKASLAALAILTPLVLAVVILYLSNDQFAQMLAERFTLGESYDVGYYGRYNRYLLAIPLILENPLGLGLLEVEKYFPEPIHNVWMGSFLYFGWIAGFAWSLLMIIPIQLAWYNWRRTQSNVCVLILFGWLAVISCSMVHEGERWRFMWMLTGMVWGLNARNFAPAPTAPAANGNRLRAAMA
jgi:hypothetical protein